MHPLPVKDVVVIVVVDVVVDVWMLCSTCPACCSICAFPCTGTLLHVSNIISCCISPGPFSGMDGASVKRPNSTVNAMQANAPGAARGPLPGGRCAHDGQGKGLCEQYTWHPGRCQPSPAGGPGDAHAGVRLPRERLGWRRACSSYAAQQGSQLIDAQGSEAWS